MKLSLARSAETSPWCETAHVSSATLAARPADAAKRSRDPGPLINTFRQQNFAETLRPVLAKQTRTSFRAAARSIHRFLPSDFSTDAGHHRRAVTPHGYSHRRNCCEEPHKLV